MSRRRIYIIPLTILLFIIIASFLVVKNAGNVVKYKLEKTLGKGFSVERIDLSWRELKAVNTVLKKPDETVFFRAGKVSMTLNIKGLIRKDFRFSRVILSEPYLLLETDRTGRYINPFDSGKEQKKEASFMPEVSIGKFVVTKGSIDYSDGKVSHLPHLTRFRDIEFEIDNLSMPFIDSVSPFRIEASIPGNHSTGSIRSNGKINLRTREMDGKVIISNLDITDFRPYFEKSGDAKITKGFLDINMDIAIKNSRIRTPGRAVLRGLEFASTTTRDRFLGIPRSAVMSLLEDSHGVITIDFIIEGDINNPKFNLRESLLQKITIGLADKLGLSVTRIGESIIVEGARQVEKGISGIGREIRRLFK